MCENCEKQELDIEEQELDMTTDERYIELEIEKELDRLDREIIFNEDTKADFIKLDNFALGINDASYYAGFYTGLINMGISSDKAFEIIFNQQNIKFNLEASKLNADTNIEVSKNQSINLEKSQL